MKESYVFEYQNETDFKKKERTVRKYNMLAYKKLTFEYYPKIRNGEFLGKLINQDKNKKKYELVLPTDEMFVKVHGEIKLHYTVYEDKKIVLLTNITPEGILEEGYQTELTAYKGVMLNKSNPVKDMFKINLLNMLDKTNTVTVSVKHKKTINSSNKNSKLNQNAENKKQTDNETKTENVRKMIDKKDDNFQKIKNKIEKLIDNHIENIDLTYYKNKFREWILVHLAKKQKTYSQIKTSFVNYILKTCKDEVIVNNIKILNNNQKFDYNLMLWLNELVKEKRLTTSQIEDNYFYQTNIDKLSVEQKKVLNRKSEINILSYFVIIILLAILFTSLYIIKRNHEENCFAELDIHIIMDTLDKYNGNIHSKLVTRYFKEKLESFKEDDDFYDAVDFLFELNSLVFTNNKMDNKDNYYLKMSHDYYYWLEKEIIRRSNKKILYTVENKRGNSICEDVNSVGGVLEIDDYTFQYIYEKKYYSSFEMSYYIYYNDYLIKTGYETVYSGCDDETKPSAIFEKYYEENVNYIHDYKDNKIISLNLNDKNKTITFIDTYNNKKFELTVYDKDLEKYNYLVLK